MSVQVISIKPEYVRFLLFLYPTYTFTQSGNVVNKFITCRDIKSPAEMNSVKYHYSDAVIVSSQLYDEVWDEEVLKNKCVEYARVHFKSRKKSVPVVATEGDEFIDELIKFMFGGMSFSDEGSIFELFNSFGSKAFDEQYIKYLETHPFPPLKAAMLTFISKVISDSTSIYYKKKFMQYGSKIKINFIRAYDSYIVRGDDIYGLSFLKFLKDLL